MKFNSQICTTKEQSERLLALGVKRETADCQYAALVVDWKGNPISNLKWRFYDHNKGFIVQNFERMECIPAWSLHRLMEMMPTVITHDDYSLILGVNATCVYYADDEYAETFKAFEGNLYECVVKCVEWLIKEGYFNKEYLEGVGMVHISDDRYKCIAKFLREQGSYWSGRIGGNHWVFNASISIYDNDLIPVWYEFHTDGQNNDFSFDKLKEFYKR